MDQIKVVPCNNPDPHDFDDHSILFAKYYFRIRTFYFLSTIVNHEEINVIHKKYEKIRKYIQINIYYSKSETDGISLMALLSCMNLKPLPIFEIFFSSYPNHFMYWNDFFQFVMFFGIGPMASTIYAILNFLPEYDGRIHIV